MRVTLKPLMRSGDRDRAGRILDQTRRVIARYKDHRRAVEDGYKPFLAQLRLPEYHFTNYWYGFKANFALRRRAAHVAAVREGGRGLPSHGRDVHRARGRVARGAGPPRASQRGAVAPAHVVVHAAGGPRHRDAREERALRLRGEHPHARGVRRRGRAVLPAHVRLDGPRVSVREAVRGRLPDARPSRPQNSSFFRSISTRAWRCCGLSVPKTRSRWSARAPFRRPTASRPRAPPRGSASAAPSGAQPIVGLPFGARPKPC